MVNININKEERKSYSIPSNSINVENTINTINTSAISEGNNNKFNFSLNKEKVSVKDNVKSIDYTKEKIYDNNNDHYINDNTVGKNQHQNIDNIRQDYKSYNSKSDNVVNSPEHILSNNRSYNYSIPLLSNINTNNIPNLSQNISHSRSADFTHNINQNNNNNHNNTNNNTNYNTQNNKKYNNITNNENKLEKSFEHPKSTSPIKPYKLGIQNQELLRKSTSPNRLQEENYILGTNSSIQNTKKLNQTYLNDLNFTYENNKITPKQAKSSSNTHDNNRDNNRDFNDVTFRSHDNESIDIEKVDRVDRVDR